MAKNIKITFFEKTSDWLNLNYFQRNNQLYDHQLFSKREYSNLKNT